MTQSGQENPLPKAPLFSQNAQNPRGRLIEANSDLDNPENFTKINPNPTKVMSTVPMHMSNPDIRLRDQGTSSQPTSTLEDHQYNGIITVLWLIVLIILVCSVFVIPKPFRIFWLVISTLIILMTVGFRLYAEWMNRAQMDGSDRHKEWSMGLLYCLVILYTIVMLSILFILAWKIIGVVTNKSNILKEHAVNEYEHGSASNHYDKNKNSSTPVD
jgi:hypothetical protein